MLPLVWNDWAPVLGALFQNSSSCSLGPGADGVGVGGVGGC